MALHRTAQSLVAIALILALGAPAWFWITKKSPPPTAPLRELGPVPVSTRAVSGADVTVEVAAYGTLLPARRVPLTLEVSGRVEEVHPNWIPGGSAREGEVLCVLEDRPFELEERAARARLDEALAGVERAKTDLASATAVLEKSSEQLELSRTVHRREVELMEGGGSSQAAVDRARLSLVAAELALENARAAEGAARSALALAEATVATAHATVEQAIDRRARRVLVAPFDGRLTGRAPERGSYAAGADRGGLPLGELVDVATLHLSLQVFEDDLPGLVVGLPAAVTLPSRPGLELPGRVRAVGRVVDATTRSAAVEIEIQNGGEPGEDALAAGQFAAARIAVRELEGALVVGRGEFVWDGDRPVAFVADGGACEARALELGRAVGEGFVVRSGLVAGERLVVHPLDRLGPGVAIEVTGGAAEEPR